MKLVLVICSLWAVAWAQEPSLSCIYYDEGATYKCELTIYNPNSFNNFTEIGGTHLTGFSNADVNSIVRRSGNTGNIPQIICDTFPNIAQFDLFNSGINAIDDSALSGCSRITRLFLTLNRISSISASAFVNLRDVTRMDLDLNLLATLPDNLFANQQNLTNLGFSHNLFEDLPSALFRPISNLSHLDWSGNRITLSADRFANLEQLRSLYLSNNGINEILPGTFARLTNLQVLYLHSNNFTELPADSFPDLGQLKSLDIGSNRLLEIDDNAFRGLEGLSVLLLSGSNLRILNSNALQNLTDLTFVDLSSNEIEDIPEGTFAAMPNLNYVSLWGNRLKTIRRNSFGSLTALQSLHLDRNIVNALDREIIDDAVNLETLNLNGNLCANNYFGDFVNNRTQHLPMLESCFRNMRYIVDTTTEGDDVYSFFEAPLSGIVLRVQSDNEVQIAIAPLNFWFNPMIEIFIGATNNTRSVIRIDQGTDVVSVPTPNIIQQNQWNDFRVTWADQQVLVFSGNDRFPFLSYTMQNLFPISFYGLRAVETRATWSIQPFHLDVERLA